MAEDDTPVQSASDAEPGPAQSVDVQWLPAPARRARWPWVTLLVVVLVGAAVAGTVWLIGDARSRADAARALSAAQQAAIADVHAAHAEIGARIAAQRDAFRTDLAGWQADLAGAEAWQESDQVPPEQAANPGGAAIPGDDPEGRAFLDSIGATDVRVRFDAGSDNCGYTSVAKRANSFSAGGCYDSRFRNWLLMAWEPGGESLVWPIFVHEAMHWYQYQQYYPIFLSASRAGVSHDAYRAAVESDASCRAVIVHGIDPSEYERSSSPCDVDGWYEGWLRDQIAALGVRVSEPISADYEVQEVVRP